ncbi:MAG: serine hydrolase [Gemmatimonadetes bacterium]|nr:serine hydrolase [Gemmatimonadota bacterium]
MRGFSALVLLAIATARPLGAQQSVPPDARHAATARELDRLIRHEVEDKALPSVTIALVDDQRIVWAQAWGFADLERRTPATAETVHRVGSVSKLFTDIGIMQLVERGELDLDAPVTRYLPSFAPRGFESRQITLRHLMAHRSGLLREPPVGNYFDPEGSTLAAMVASVNDRDLVYPPGERTKYSIAAIALVGYILEARSGEPFARYLQRAVLEPMGLSSSSFAPSPGIVERLSKAYMWARDGRQYAAPTFELGMAPAGSMYSTVLDLGRFLSTLFAGGRTPSGVQVLQPATIEAMWTPQFSGPGQARGFGIGFALSTLEGQRRVGHGGAIYGFATDVAALPDARLGVVVVTTLDVANSVSERISDAALRAMLAEKTGRPVAPVRIPAAIDPALAKQLEGRYAQVATGNGAGTPFIDLVERYGALFLDDRDRFALRVFGDTLVVDDRIAFGRRLLPLADGRLITGRDTLTRVAVPKPAPAPARWAGLIGEYGWDHNTLYILERDGVLHALIEWFFLYPLEEVSTTEFRFPAWGLYDGESLRFMLDAEGRAQKVVAASVTFDRREVGTDEGVTFRIAPVRPVTELRALAAAASPPRETGEFRETDLVELRALDPTIRYDIRYATANNFMAEPFYAEARALLQRPAAEALARVHRSLATRGYGLLIHDAYRPWSVTKMFWDATPPEFRHFVADPASGSRHNRGAAVDLTLYDLATGEPVRTVGGYDEFSARSYPDYPGGTTLQRWHRELLRDAMEAEGFTVYEWEWWHFDYQSWRSWRIGNVPFPGVR